MRIISGLYAIILCIIKPPALMDYVDNPMVFFGQKKGESPMIKDPPPQKF